MAITLGEARAYAVDIAHSMSGTKADVFANRWIRQAVQRLWEAHAWIHYDAKQRITLEPQESGTDGVLVQGGSTAVRGSTWTAKYASQAWDLLFTADATKVFSIASIATVTATFGTGEVWTAASVPSAGAYSLSRYRYSLPNDFLRRNELVFSLDGRHEVHPLPARDFDILRNQNPGLRQSQPDFYCIRGAGYIEFFPAPGSDYGSLQLTYSREPVLNADADANSVSVDWPEEYRRVFHLAIEVEAARIQGKAAQVPYSISKPELDEAIASAWHLDVQKASRPRSMGLDMSRRTRYGLAPLVRAIGTFGDPA